MESSFSSVELRELRGPSGPVPTSAAWTSVSAGRPSRGFENASYQQEEEQNQQPLQSTNCPPSTSNNFKVGLFHTLSFLFKPTSCIINKQKKCGALQQTNVCLYETHTIDPQREQDGSMCPC